MFLVKVYDVKLVKPSDVQKLIAVHTEHIEKVKDEEEEKTRITYRERTEHIREGQYV
jgi:hypothetical protein